MGFLMANSMNPSESPADLRLRYYADLVESGGLGPAIFAVAGGRQGELGGFVEEVPLTASRWSAAEFASPRGAMRVNLGYGVRRFAVTLDGHGHVWASGSTPSLSEVVDVLLSWRQGVKLAELNAVFPFMEFGRLSQAYEDGNPREVQWDILIEDDAFLMYRELLVKLREETGMRELFPYFSHWTLRLSKDQQDVQSEEILIRPAADEEGFDVWSSSAPEHKSEFRTVDEVVRAALFLVGEL
ncbi:DUF6193 family natural product biosynthesis protein [Streptomyces niveus]|uniref:DUF6193 family natural product biosynthesis protein n=1 Tax=Streptomyces niveus TaxID=193462 RepID=UPI0033D09F24